MTEADRDWLGTVTASLSAPTWPEMAVLAIGGVVVLAYIALAILIVEGWQ